MPIYIASSVEEEPTIYLERWSVRRTDLGFLHFVGFDIASQDGRVSTAVERFDPVRRIAVTASGRRYWLTGPGGYDSDAEYVWAWAVKNWGVSSWTNVTAEVAPDWRRGLPNADTAIEDGDLFDVSSLPPVPNAEAYREVVGRASPEEPWHRRISYRMTARRLSLTDTDGDADLISVVTGEGDVSLPISNAIARDEVSCFLSCIGYLFRPHSERGGLNPEHVALDPFATVTIERLLKQGDADGEVVATLRITVLEDLAHGSVSSTEQVPRDLGSMPVAPADGVWDIVARFLSVGGLGSPVEE